MLVPGSNHLDTPHSLYVKNNLSFKINSSWKGFDLDVKSLYHSPMRNMYPTRFIDRVVRQFLDKKFSKTINEKIPENGLEIR